MQKIKSRITNQKDENKDLPKYLPLPGFKKTSSCSFELLSLYFHFHQNSLQHFSQGRFNSVKLLPLNYLRISKFSFFKDMLPYIEFSVDRFLFQPFVLSSPCLLTSLVAVLVAFWVQGTFIFNENHLLLLLRTSCFCFAPFKILFLFSFWKFNYSVSM